MARRSVTRELKFFRVFTSVPGRNNKGSRPGSEDHFIDWAELAQRVADARRSTVADGDGRAILRFRAHPELEPPALTVYRPFVPGGTVKIDDASEEGALEVMDVDYETGFSLANASAFFFLAELPGVMVTLHGDTQGGAPPATALRTVLEQVAPQGDERRWQVKPLHKASELEELRRAAGANQIRYKALHDESLFTSSEDPKFAEAAEGGMATIARQLIGRLGFPAEVKVSVKIPSEYRSRETQRKLKELIVLEADGSLLVGPETKVHAVGGGAVGMGEELLTLGEHRLAATLEFDLQESEALRFSTLLERTAGLLKVQGLDLARQAVEVNSGPSNRSGS
ncbi:hypothetical protein ACFU1Q_11275 [Brachybacterium paraconglomeratum]